MIVRHYASCCEIGVATPYDSRRQRTDRGTASCYQDCGWRLFRIKSFRSQINIGLSTENPFSHIAIPVFEQEAMKTFELQHNSKRAISGMNRCTDHLAEVGWFLQNTIFDKEFRDRRRRKVPNHTRHCCLGRRRNGKREKPKMCLFEKNFCIKNAQCAHLDVR